MQKGKSDNNNTLILRRGFFKYIYNILGKIFRNPLWDFMDLHPCEEQVWGKESQWLPGYRNRGPEIAEKGLNTNTGVKVRLTK